MNGRARLILASGSPRRAALLQQVGIAPDEIVAPSVDERSRKNENPRLYALRVSKDKIGAVKSADGAIVLAADTVVACGRRILPKAENDADVVSCLNLLSGRRHSVLTAIAIAAGSGKIRTRVVVTKVAFKRLTTAEIDAYVACGEGVGKAGGYAIQGRAEAFVRQINGSYSNVVGLPLYETVALLAGAGFRVPS